MAKNVFGKVKRFQQPAPLLSREQGILRDMFQGEPTFGTGRNLPVVTGRLITGGGIIKSGDRGETAAMFGGY